MTDVSAPYDRDALAWELAEKVCREAEAVSEDVEKHTVFDEFDEPVRLALLGPPLAVEVDGCIRLASNVLLQDSMQVRVVEFSTKEFSVFLQYRSTGKIGKIWWDVCRDGKYSHVTMRGFVNWSDASSIADADLIDLRKMYGSSAVEDEGSGYGHT